jgi:hypothetical protein
MKATVPQSSVLRFRNRAQKELHAQIPGIETPHIRIERLRDLAQSAKHLVSLDWGSDLPHPSISQELLEIAANESEAIDWLSERVTTDEYIGCWALPLKAEFDEKNRARYPTLTSKRFEAQGELAHRFVVRRLMGSLATEEHLDHICRVHACCNPLHLSIVTQATNTRRGIIARNSVVGQHRFDY